MQSVGKLTIFDFSFHVPRTGVKAEETLDVKLMPKNFKGIVVLRKWCVDQVSARMPLGIVRADRNVGAILPIFIHALANGIIVNQFV